jgi:CHASE3 domain sensor protein
MDSEIKQVETPKESTVEPQTTFMGFSMKSWGGFLANCGFAGVVVALCVWQTMSNRADTQKQITYLYGVIEKTSADAKEQAHESRMDRQAFWDASAKQHALIVESIRSIEKSVQQYTDTIKDVLMKIDFFKPKLPGMVGPPP